MRRWWIAVCLAGLLVAAQAAQSDDELHPTPWFVNFLGQQSTLDGQPLPVGAVVRAYDPSGVLAGRVEVALDGWYLVSVYGDDHTTTPYLDEGADPGDRVAFTVNGYQTVPLGPDPPVWTEPGSLVHVELRACTLPGDFDCDCRVTVIDMMRQAQGFGASQGQVGYYPPFDRDGDGDIDVRDIQLVAALWRTTCPG